MPRIVYSVIIPLYNEAEVLPEFYRHLSKVMDTLDGRSEFVFVDDGSTDGSLNVLAGVREHDPRVKVLSLSRNFGHQIALTAGLDYASGEAVIVIDADLQDPPELIPQLVAKWRDGYEVVYAVRQHRRGESTFKRATAALFYRGIHRITNIEIPLDVGDYRLLGGRAVKALRSMREKHRFVRGMVSWVGFRQIGVPYTRDERHAGSSKYPLRKMI